jgi:alpha-L-fucosidase
MKTNTYVLVIIALIIAACQPKVKEKAIQPEIQDFLVESTDAFNKRMEWWRDARFGMFIHWGVYSVPAGIYKGEDVKGIGEWIMKHGQIPIEEYEQYAKQFNPEKFNADEWVKIIKDAGMKYLVITSKHHDGFGLWDSKVSDYDIVDFAPYGKDILKALSDACQENGIKFGLYHSIMDWHHPDAQAFSYLKDDPNKRSDNKKNFAEYLEKYLKPQVKELIENYNPDIMWFDGEWVEEFTHEQGQQLYQYVRSLKPNILINNRVDKGRAGMQGMNKEDGVYAGDFGTPEQEILETASALDWESCMTMNDTWGFKKNDHNWKSADMLIHNLIDVSAKGGNYLLNVGPTSEGLIPEPSIERLTKMGAWLAVNGEAIYATEKRNGNYKQGDNIRFTKKKGKDIYYAFVTDLNESKINLTGLKPNASSNIFVLGYDVALEWEYNNEEGIFITIPASIMPGKEGATPVVFKIEGVEI